MNARSKIEANLNRSFVRITLTQFLLALAFTFITYHVLYYILTIGIFQNESPATCLPNHCFCENTSNTDLKQISNSISSLAFSFIAFCILIQTYLYPNLDINHRLKLQFKTMLSTIFGIAILCIGIGSFIFHATLSFVGQFLDVASMNLLANFILLIHINFRVKFQEKTFLFFYILLNILTCFLIWYIPELRRVLFALILILSICYLLFFVKRGKLIALNYLFLAIFVQLLALLIWNLDLNKIFCLPNSWMQGHAIWHMLGAGVCYLLYLFYELNQFGKVD